VVKMGRAERGSQGVSYSSMGSQIWDCTSLGSVLEILNLSDSDWVRITFAGVLPASSLSLHTEAAPELLRLSVKFISRFPAQPLNRSKYPFYVRRSTVAHYIFLLGLADGTPTDRKLKKYLAAVLLVHGFVRIRLPMFIIISTSRTHKGELEIFTFTYQ
jgi:hypothetical protein